MLIKKITPQKKKKKTIKYSKNSEREEFKESLKRSKTAEGLKFKLEFNQLFLRKSNKTKDNSGECCKITKIKS